MFVFFVLIEDSLKSSKLGFTLIKVKRMFRIRNTVCNDKHRKMETLLWFEKTAFCVLQWWLIILGPLSYFHCLWLIQSERKQIIWLRKKYFNM